MKKSEYDYRSLHIGDGSFAKNYDESLFAKGTFDYEIWFREKKIILDIIGRNLKRRKRYLDFACGTGRVISFLENHFEDSVGIDISPDMLNKARKKVNDSLLIEGDITQDDNLVDGKFDCITAFRFFLNAQPELRREVMGRLVSMLDDEGILIFNIHGNTYSTRWPIVAVNKIRGINLFQMTHNNVMDLINDAGLKLIEKKGIVWLDKAFYNYMPKTLWKIMDNTMSTMPLMEKFAVYNIYACKKSEYL